MAEIRVRRDGSIRLPDEIMDAAGLNPQTKIRVRLKGKTVVIEKVAMAEDPFAAAAKGPDTDALDKIREKQREDAERAKDRFKELIENPPEIKPEDNPDLWR